MRDAYILVVGTTGASRQRGEGDNDIRMGLVELDRELFGTMGLVLHHHQTLHTLHSLTMHRKLGTEDYDVKILCDSIIVLIKAVVELVSHLREDTHILAVIITVL